MLRRCLWKLNNDIFVTSTICNNIIAQSEIKFAETHASVSTATVSLAEDMFGFSSSVDFAGKSHPSGTPPLKKVTRSPIWLTECPFYIAYHMHNLGRWQDHRNFRWLQSLNVDDHDLAWITMFSRGSSRHFVPQQKSRKTVPVIICNKKMTKWVL